MTSVIIHKSMYLLDVLPLLKCCLLVKSLKKYDRLDRLSLISERQRVQSDPNYRLLNIPTVRGSRIALSECQEKAGSWQAAYKMPDKTAHI